MSRALKLLLAFAISTLAAPASAVVTVLDGMQSITVTRGSFTPSIRVKLSDDQGHAAAGRKLNIAGTGISTKLPTVACCSDGDGIVTIAPVYAPAVETISYSLSSEQLGSTKLAIDIVPRGPVLQIAPVQGDGQRVMQNAAFAPIKLRATRDGVPVAGRTVSCSTASGPALDSVPLRATTDSNGEASLPAFIVTTGHGTGLLKCTATDDVEGMGVETTAKYYVTYPDGRTWAELAPLWWNPAASGWGVSVPQHEERVFPVMFTYRKGAPIWYVLDGAWTGGFGASYKGYFNEYRGAPYYAFDTAKVTASQHGYGAFTFSALGIDRADFGTAILPGYEVYCSQSGQCFTYLTPVVPFAFPPAVPQAQRGLGDIWWGGPSQSGWGISIAEDHGNLFLAWFTYDGDGMPTWFSMPEGQWNDASTWKGPVYRTTGDGFLVGDAVLPRIPYAATKVGDFTIRFSGTTAATFTYNVDGHAGTLNLQRFDY